jgi:hypothetical protein
MMWLVTLMMEYVHTLNNKHHFSSGHMQFEWAKAQAADLLINNNMCEPSGASEVYTYVKMKYNKKVRAASLAPCSP